MDEQEQTDQPTRVSARPPASSRLVPSSLPPGKIADGPTTRLTPHGVTAGDKTPSTTKGADGTPPPSKFVDRTPSALTVSKSERPATTSSASQEMFAPTGSSVRALPMITSVAGAQNQTAIDGHRLLSGSMLLWCLAGVPMMLLTPGTRTDKVVVAIGITIVAMGYGWLFRRAIRNEIVHVEEVLPFGLVSALAGQMIALGVGICSPYSALIALAFTLFATRVGFRQSCAIFIVLSVTHLVLGTLAATGVTASTGLLDPEPRSSASIILNTMWIEIIYATAFAIGQVANREGAQMMARFETAVRDAAQRDALWREVRAELDRAAKLGGDGQFSGQDLAAYKLAEVIGRGGMGEVYAAHRRDDGSEVAVKLLRRDVLSDPDVVARFEREAHIVAQFESPHVVAVLEVGGRDAPVPYIAMERLRGSDLAAELRNLGVLPLREAVTLVSEVAEGLSVAHAAGIVHRDLKPSNLFHAEDSRGRKRWKVLDFGVSKLVASEDATLTLNQLVGTPQYMAPEQAAGARDIDQRADVHALAAIAYRAVSGHVAFSKGDVGKVLLAVGTEIPEDPRQAGNVSEELAFVLRVGLAKKPAERFTTAQEFAAAFRAAADGNVPAEIRDRAQSLLAREPWGATIDRV